MKWLITGGAGYIGMELTYKLRKRDHTIQVYDIKHGNDIRDYENLHSQMQGMDVCVHLAAISGFGACDQDPARTITTNINGTLNVLAAAKKLDVTVIFTSSISTKAPDRLYSITKKIGEELCSLYGQTALRLSNVYGGNNYLEMKKSVISAFIQDNPLTIYGSGNQSRDFIHVDDVVTAIMAAAKAKTESPIDVTTGKLTTINEVADIVCKYIPDKIVTHRSGWKTRNSPVTEPYFRTFISLEEGIKRLLEVKI